MRNGFIGKNKQSSLTGGNNEAGSRLLGQDGHPPQLEAEQLAEPLGQVQGTAPGQLQTQIPGLSASAAQPTSPPDTDAEWAVQPEAEKGARPEGKQSQLLPHCTDGQAAEPAEAPAGGRGKW